MTPRIRYRGTSGVDVRLDTASVGLATHADTQQGYLNASVVRVDVVRDVLRAAHAMAWPLPPADATAAAHDAWFSVFDDVVFVEVPAPDGRAWLRMRLARAVFAQARDVATGTTTLRLPWSLGRELRRLSPARATSFVASPGGSDPAIDGSILDEHAALPTEAAWRTALRLAGGAAPASTIRVPPSALVRPLAQLVPADADAPLVIAADPPWRADPIVVPGGARLRAMAPLLAHARQVSFDAAGDVTVIDGDHVTATLTLAREAHDERGAATAFDDADPSLERHAGDGFVDVDGTRRRRPLATPDAR